MRKMLITLIVILFATCTFSAIGYEHFTVQENQVFVDLLVKLSRAFKGVQNQSDWENETLMKSIMLIITIEIYLHIISRA